MVMFFIATLNHRGHVRHVQEELEGSEHEEEGSILEEVRSWGSRLLENLPSGDD